MLKKKNTEALENIHVDDSIVKAYYQRIRQKILIVTA